MQSVQYEAWADSSAKWCVTSFCSGPRIVRATRPKNIAPLISEDR